MDLFKLILAPKKTAAISKRAFSALSSKSKPKCSTIAEAAETLTENLNDSASTKSNESSFGQTFQQVMIIRRPFG